MKEEKEIIKRLREVLLPPTRLNTKDTLLVLQGRVTSYARIKTYNDPPRTSQSFVYVKVDKLLEDISLIKPDVTRKELMDILYTKTGMDIGWVPKTDEIVNSGVLSS